MDSPLAATLAEAAGTAPYWRVRVRGPGDPPGTALAGLADEEAMTPALAALDAELDGGRALAGQTLVARLAGPAVGVPAELLFRTSRVPLPDPSTMAFVLAAGGAGTAPPLLLDPATPLLVLDGDPLAGEPGTERVPDRDRLRATLLEWAHTAFAPVVETASRLSRRGRRALWQTIADRLGNGFLLAGRAGGDLAGARAEFESTLAGAAVRALRVRPDWVEVPHGGTVELFRRRSVCCLYYTSRVHGEQYCATCPLLPREETLARLRDTVAQQDDDAPHAGPVPARAGPSRSAAGR